MRKILFLMPLYLILSCDPQICSEERIANNSKKDLKITFVSSDTLFNNQIFIEKNSTITIGEIECALGGVVVNYSVYDSIYLRNSINEILKVYKKNTTGKNIYNIDDYWSVRKTSKNHFEYIYEITNEDIEE